ncbi:hypothetical protein [Nitrosomonas communis]|uniref:Uncharacterized protein n=1 Tax=Nitrosomonas communis TaxID=44574 RepID=A0A1I4M8M7_9PROT|nr:hypothetical protein [Nitrosomonas communis]SFL99544.1 hypothetical protein SAMN05421863_10099 [Nitrosomonas communis]
MTMEKSTTTEPVNISTEGIAKQLETHIAMLERFTAILSDLVRRTNDDEIGRLTANGRDLCDEINCSLFQLWQKLDEHKAEEVKRHYAILSCPDRSLCDVSPDHYGHIYEFDTKKDRDTFLSVTINPLFQKVVVIIV